MLEAPKGRRVLLVADRPVIRASIAQVLKKGGFEIIGEVGSRKETLTHSKLKQADVALLVLLLGDGDTLGLVKDLRRRRVRCVVCAIHGDSARVQKTFAAGAAGYVTQGDESAHLFEALNTVADGRHYISPRAGARLARNISGLDAPAAEDELSEQQWQIYKLLGRGESTHDIAKRIRISPRTVETYCYRMIEKLDLSGMKALRRHAISDAHNIA